MARLLKMPSRAVIFVDFIAIFAMLINCLAFANIGEPFDMAKCL